MSLGFATCLRIDSFQLQSLTHTRKAAGLISMITDIPEGRQVLAQRRMSGRVAKVFTSDCSEYLQVVFVLLSYMILLCLVLIVHCVNSALIHLCQTRIESLHALGFCLVSHVA